MPSILQKRGSFLRKNLFNVVPDGLEPPLTEPKTVVLPLHHGTLTGAKVLVFGHATKFSPNFFRNTAKNNGSGSCLSLHSPTPFHTGTPHHLLITITWGLHSPTPFHIGMPLGCIATRTQRLETSHHPPRLLLHSGQIQPVFYPELTKKAKSMVKYAPTNGWGFDNKLVFLTPNTLTNQTKSATQKTPARRESLPAR